MNQHSAVWPQTKMTDVEILERYGAWYVSYIGEDGTRYQIRKYNGPPKGFRSLDTLVPFLCFVIGIVKFGVTAQARRR